MSTETSKDSPTIGQLPPPADVPVTVALTAKTTQPRQPKETQPEPASLPAVPSLLTTTGSVALAGVGLASGAGLSALLIGGGIAAGGVGLAAARDRARRRREQRSAVNWPGSGPSSGRFGRSRPGSAGFGSAGSGSGTRRKQGGGFGSGTAASGGRTGRSPMPGAGRSGSAPGGGPARSTRQGGPSGSGKTGGLFSGRRPGTGSGSSSRWPGAGSGSSSRGASSRGSSGLGTSRFGRALRAADRAVGAVGRGISSVGAGVRKGGRRPWSAAARAAKRHTKKGGSNIGALLAAAGAGLGSVGWGLGWALSWPFRKAVKARRRKKLHAALAAARARRDAAKAKKAGRIADTVNDPARENTGPQAPVPVPAPAPPFIDPAQDQTLSTDRSTSMSVEALREMVNRAHEMSALVERYEPRSALEIRDGLNALGDLGEVLLHIAQRIQAKHDPFPIHPALKAAFGQATATQARVAEAYREQSALFHRIHAEQIARVENPNFEGPNSWMWDQAAHGHGPAAG